MAAGEVGIETEVTAEGVWGCVWKTGLLEAVIWSYYWRTVHETMKSHSKEKNPKHSNWEDSSCGKRGIMSLSVLFLPEWKRKERRFCSSKSSNLIEVRS